MDEVSLPLPPPPFAVAEEAAHLPRDECVYSDMAAASENKPHAPSPEVLGLDVALHICEQQLARLRMYDVMNVMEDLVEQIEAVFGHSHVQVKYDNYGSLFHAVIMDALNKIGFDVLSSKESINGLAYEMCLWPSESPPEGMLGFKFKQAFEEDQQRGEEFYIQRFTKELEGAIQVFFEQATPFVEVCLKGVSIHQEAFNAVRGTYEARGFSIRQDEDEWCVMEPSPEALAKATKVMMEGPCKELIKESD